MKPAISPGNWFLSLGFASNQRPSGSQGSTHRFLAIDDALKADVALVYVRSELDHKLRWQVPNLIAQDIVDSHGVGVVSESGLGCAWTEKGRADGVAYGLLGSRLRTTTSPGVTMPW